MGISYHYFEPTMIDDALNNMVRSLHFVEMCLMFSLFIFCRVLALSWRHYVWGIALGFALKSTMQTLAESLWLQSGYPALPSQITCSPLLISLDFLSGLTFWPPRKKRRRSHKLTVRHNSRAGTLLLKNLSPRGLEPGESDIVLPESSRSSGDTNNSP
jgi:hypothetical protein